MNWFKFLRLVGSSKQKPLAKKHGRARKLSLRLETLEERDVPAVPSVLSVTPGTGSQFNPTTGAITVTFSEDVTGANVANNYQLFAKNGQAVSIGSIQYTVNGFGQGVATIQASTLNGGTSIGGGAYSLFLRGQNIFSVSTNDPLSRPGEVVVANNGSGNISTSGVHDTTTVNAPSLNAPDTIAMPSGSPRAIATSDIDGDGQDELIIATTANQVLIYRGTDERGYSSTPTVTLALPANANPSALAVDNSGDIIVANQGTDNVSAFTNQSSAGAFSFSKRGDFAAGKAPIALVLGNFNVDPGFQITDVAVVNQVINGSASQVTILPGLNTANVSFGAGTVFTVGTNGNPPAGLQVASSLAVGNFGGGFGDDLAVGGINGITVLINSSTNTTPAFGAAVGGLFGTPFLGIGNITSVAAGIYRSSGGGGDDILATTTSGQLVGLLNSGLGVFRPTGAINAGVSNPNHLIFGNNRILYTSNGGFISRPLTQAGLIDNASNAGPIVITSLNHGLATGQRVTITGVVGNTAANGTFFVTVINANSFSLNGSTGNGTATPNTGTWIAVPESISNVVADGVNPIRITSINHGFRTGQQISISGVAGVTGANGTFFITVIDANTFTLNGTEGQTGTFVQTGNAFASPPLYITGSLPVGIALTDFDDDGTVDAIVGNQGSGTATMYLGSPDGTFLNSTIQGAGFLTRQPVVGDVNKDGVPDLVVPISGSDAVFVYLGLKQGGYANPITLSTTFNANSRTPVALALGDLNNDGNLDIVAISQMDNNAVVFLGNGDGTFQTALAPRTTVGQRPTDIALADINKDGVLDLIVGHNGFGAAGNRGVTVRLGNGNGTFQNVTELLSGTMVTALGVADFDRDGNVDFVASADEAPGRVILMYGKGNGSFTNGGSFTVAPNPTDILIADINNDGYQDVTTVSGFDQGPRNISVLLNNRGIGFQAPLYTKVDSDKPLQSVAALHLNDDAFLDLVVTEGDFLTNFNANQGPNNVYTLYGQGNGSFINGVSNTMGGVTSPGTVPSYVATVTDTIQLLTTFDVKVSTVEVDLVNNGDFETRSQTGERGNLDGWTTFDLRDSTGGSHGTWGVQARPDDRFAPNLSPLSSTPTGPISDSFRAILDQQNLNPSVFGIPSNFQGFDDDYDGSHAIYQDIVIPANASTVTLSLELYLKNFSFNGWTDTGITPPLDYRTGARNQQVRVDIMDPTTSTLDITPGTGVLRSLFVTSPTNLNEFTTTITDADLTAFKGRRIRIRIATTNNDGPLIVGVDNLSVIARLTDTTGPTISDLRLRNPSFLASASTLDQSTDLTVVGQVGDNGSINNVQQVIFDFAGNGFGSRDDVATSAFDAQGFFAVKPTTTLPAGPRTITVRLIDGAGNVTDRQFSFIVQGPSLASWQAVGPGPIDISAEGLDFSTIAGKITGIAVDNRDPSGNTMFISAGNGGVWRTTDGGANWRSLTDNVKKGDGTRVNVAASSVVVASNGTVYASTGVDDISFASRSGVGVLRSIDDGRTWQVIGGGVLAGARVSKMVVDPTDPNTIYVAVTAWDTPGKKAALFKGIIGANGSATWTDVLDPAKMFLPGSTTSLVASGNASLASVTDIVIDPFNQGRLIIGLGNIGQVANSSSAGVWKSINGGATWEKVRGGDNPSIPFNTIPGGYSAGDISGTQIGRVSLALGTGRVGDEKIVYIAMSNPTTATDNPDNAGFLGLFKTKNNLLDFTKVMLKEWTPVVNSRNTYTNINPFGREGGSVGSLLVDPTNPNVVYLGGSDRYSGGLSHGVIRVDTGNMADTTTLVTDFVNGQVVFNVITNDGDDADKESRAATLLDIYPDPVPDNDPYLGEGVYWYDLVQGASHDTGTRSQLPGAINRFAIDAQGRFLFGTDSGLYRGIQEGFGYDFMTGTIDSGILRLTGANFTTPGMRFSELNGNLEIADLTSVSVDPQDPSRVYVSGLSIGSALTPSGIGAWQTAGWRNPVTIPTTEPLLFGWPNAFQMIAVAPSPDSPAGTPSIVYRSWQAVFSNTISPDISVDGGVSFTRSNDAGLSAVGGIGRYPVLAVNPKKVFNSSENKFFDELLLGTDQVYLSRTGGAVWDSLSNFVTFRGLFGGGAGDISAVTFAPSADNVYYAGTDTGLVAMRVPSGTPGAPVANQFFNITGNLASLVGAQYRITSITVDPNDINTVYVMIGRPNGNVGAGLYRTTNATAGAGTTWTALGGATLPQTSAYSMVIDPRVSVGAPMGRFYLATERGVYASVDKGATWQVLGVNLPAVPIVNMDFDQNAEVLAIATQGRGVFTISTARSGPQVTGAAPGSLTDNPTGLARVDVTFNDPVNPQTFTAGSNVPARITAATTVLSTSEYQLARITELELQLRRRVPPQANIDAGLATFNSGPNGELAWIANVVSSGFYFNNNFYSLNTADPNFNTANKRWVEQVFRDLLGRTSVGDADLARILGILNSAAPGQELNTRMTVAQQIVGINANGVNFPEAIEFQTRQVISLYNRYLAGNTPVSATATGIYATKINATVSKLQARAPYINVLAEILASTDAYQKIGNDYTLPTGVHTNSITFGNLTGVKNTNIADNNVPAALPDNYIPDLIVSASDGKLYVFKGRVGGGYNGTPNLILNLPATANPSQVVVADFNEDGKNDIAVANAGRPGGALNSSVSVFLNTRANVGDLSFDGGTGFDGGNNPIGIAVADLDNNGDLDLVIANRTTNLAGNYTASVLLGTGTGSFAPPVPIVIGDNSPSLSELTGPTAIAVADVSGNFLPDLIISGDNGIVVLTNTSTTGLPSFTPLPGGRLTDNPITSIDVGDIDADGDIDIAATTDIANGQVLLFQHDNASDSFAGVGLAVGEGPRSVRLGDLNGDGKLDVVVANNTLDATGRITVLINNTPATPPAGPPSGTVLFSDTFPTTTFNTSNWVNSGAVINGNGINAPSAPFSANLNDTDTLTSTVIDLSAGASVVLRYSYERSGGGDPVEAGNDLILEYLDSTGVWQEIDRQLGAGTDMTDFAGRSILLPQGASHAGFRFRFRTTGDLGADDWFVDNVSLTVSGNGFTYNSPLAYPVSGTQPTAIDLADTNQDGLLDVGVGYATSEFVSLLNSKQQGIMQTPNDRGWANWLYRGVLNRPATAAERTSIENTLKAGYLAYLDGPDGAVAPLSIAPADGSNLTYSLFFPPQLLNGTYQLVVGPNASGVNLKDFTDLDGTFVNTGNAMNQNGNDVNGEYPADRSTQFRFAIDTTDTGRFISGLYTDLLGVTRNGGRAPDNNGFVSLDNIVEPAHQTALSTIAQNNTRSAEVSDRMVADLYQRYLRRAASLAEIANGNGDISGGSAAIQAGTLTVRDLVARILASTEYFNLAQTINTNPLATTPNAKWVDQIYQDLLNIPGTTSAPNFASKVAGLDNATKTRLQVATTAVFSDAAIKQTITEYFQQFLGRAPTRSNDPTLDETTNFNGVDLTALLKTAAAPGVASPDSRIVKQIISSSEYYRVVGGTDFEWTRQLFLKLRGRATVDTDPITGTEFNTKLNTLLSLYEPARQSAVAQVVNMRESRDRFYNDYYAQFFNNRVPTQGELNALDAVYAANNNRLEAVQASILSSPQYFPLTSSNSAWLAQIYQVLVGGITPNNQAVADNQLTFLNSQPTTQLQNARFTVALQVLNSTQYRQILITNFYNTYLGRSPTTAERDNLVNMMNNNGTRQGGILQQIMKTAEYFLLQSSS